jgi:DNA-binding transcriptional ArsR family regulator
VPDAPVPDAATIVGLLADETRRRVLAALVLGSATPADIRMATGLGTRAVATALARLVDAELVVRDADGTHHLLGEAFRLAAIAAAPSRSEPDPTGDVPEDEARVLRTCFRGGRLVRIPTKHSQRRIVLDRLAQEFEVGQHYSERQVNATLRRFHDDVAALRRYLVDDGFLDRAAGEYWRAGGTYR